MTDKDDPMPALTREELIALLRAPLPTVTVKGGRSWAGSCTSGDTPEARERFRAGQRFKAQYYGGTE